MLQCVAVCCIVLQCGAMCCSVFQCVAVCCSMSAICNNILQFVGHQNTHALLAYSQLGVRCNTMQHDATHCNTLQHTATHCNTLQQTATHCNALQQRWSEISTLASPMVNSVSAVFNNLPSAARCPLSCSVLQCVAVCCSELQ